MYWYKRNLGDYAKKAGRLTMLEHGAYTLLIDSCYDRERFPTEDEAIEWCWARSEEEIAAVRFILSRFFYLVDGKYVQSRIQEEIDKYHRNAEINSRIATEREAKRTNRARSVNGAITVEHEPPPNQEPRTNNQEPEKESVESSDSPSQLSGHAIEFKTFLRRCKNSGEKPISTYVPVWDYAQKVGIPENFIVLAWDQFSEKYNEGGTSQHKRYKDWRIAFRKSVEDNWFGLWYMAESGKVELTSKGRMAMEAHK